MDLGLPSKSPLTLPEASLTQHWRTTVNHIGAVEVTSTTLGHFCHACTKAWRSVTLPGTQSRDGGKKRGKEGGGRNKTWLRWIACVSQDSLLYVIKTNLNSLQQNGGAAPLQPTSQGRPNSSTRQNKAGVRARVPQREPSGHRPLRRRYWGWHLGWCPGATLQSQALRRRVRP